MKHNAEAFVVCVLSLVLFLVPADPAFAQLDGATPTTETTVAPATTEPVAAPVEPVAATATATVAPADTTAPVISGVANLSLGLSEATIAWTTDELATSRLEYGTTPSYGQNATLDASALLAHSAILTGLASGTTYYYCIHATDLAGNTSNSCAHTFTTAAAPATASSTSVAVDTTPPNISLVTATSVTTDSVTIGWTTDKVSNAEVEYGTTAGYGTVTPLDTALSLTHSVTLTGLTPNTEYHFRVRSADEIGNTAVSPDNTFTTAAPVSGGVTTTAPEASTTVSTGGTAAGAQATLLISAIETASIASSTVTIAWQTDLPADSQIEYGNSVNLGSLTPLSSTLTTSHSVTISGLSPNTNYTYRIKSKPSGALVATVSGLHEFSTLSHSTPIVAPANITSVAAASTTASGATIAWTTDKGATSQVEYGLSTGYGGLSSYSAAFTTAHSVSLANLEPGTTYHYRVKSTDEAGNITFSTDQTFTTSAPTAPQPAPTAVSTLVIGGYDQSSVDLTWQAASQNTDISYEYDVRYSTSPITEANYSSAVEAQLTPVYHSDLSPSGTERNYIIAGLSPDTTYYFAVRAKHQTSDWSAVSNVVSAKTTTGASVITSGNPQQASSAPASVPSSGSGGGGAYRAREEYGTGSLGNAASSFEPTTLKVEPADNQIVFEWNNPGEANFVRTVVVRKEGSYPASPSDGQTVYEGRGKTFTDTAVVNGTTYYYSLYSYNHSKTYSAPVRVSLAPKSGANEVTFNESGSLVSVAPVFHFVQSHKKGDKNVEVEHLQEILALENVSFPANMVTGYFGSITENALKEFQTKHGLAVTGTVDAATQAKLNTVSQAETRLAVPGDIALFNTDMKFGDQSAAVKALQEFLAYEGSYTEALISGYFGPLTKNAVMKFQRAYNITPVSGYVGYKTRHRMQQLAGF